MSATVIVETQACEVCGKTSSLEVSSIGYAAWKAGSFAQHAFPELRPAERELLISGTHVPCWDRLFPSDDED